MSIVILNTLSPARPFQVENVSHRRLVSMYCKVLKKRIRYQKLGNEVQKNLDVKMLFEKTFFSERLNKEHQWY
jgi:hypothetical protein